MSDKNNLTDKKKPSGAEYKKRRLEKQAEDAKNAFHMQKFVTKGINNCDL